MESVNHSGAHSSVHSGARWMGLLPAIVGGAAWQLQQASLWSGGLHAGFVAVALALWWVAAGPWCRGNGWQAACGVAAGLLLGAGAAGLQAQARLAERLDPVLEGRDLIVTGVVASLPRHQPGSLRFVIAPEQALLDGQPVRVPPRLLLSWYAGHGAQELDASPGGELKAGQRWELAVRLRQPHGGLNPHGFDFELWLFEQGIGATGHVRSGRHRLARLLDLRAGQPLQRMRQQVRDAVEEAVPDGRAAGVLAALVVGDQSAIDREDWDLFRVTGVAHLMSISGLHVTMFAWGVAGLTRRLWARRPAWGLRLPAPVAARWGGLVAAAGYAAFSGWGVPAQRTVWMLAAVVVLAQWRRRWPWSLVLAAAAAVVALADPWALLQPGFWLSFVAVAILMASEGSRWATATLEAAPAAGRLTAWMARWRSVLAAGWRTQVLATVGLAPLTLVFFQQVSLVGLAANLVAIPLVTLLVTPLAMAGVIWAPVWALAASCVQALCAWLGWLATWPWAQWTTAAVPMGVAAAGLAGGWLMTLPLPWRLRLLGLPLLWPLLFPPAARPAPGQFELLAADVGQGTAVLVRTAGHTLLYDAGPLYGRDSDAGQRVVLPLLQALGERRIDLLMLSHRDADHVGGAGAVLQQYPATPVSSSLEPGHPLLAAMASHQRCQAGQDWTWDGVRFTVLHPGAGDQSPPLKPNQVSCVLRVEAGGRVALLAGDIERGEEARLVRDQAEALAADLLVAPHHGSKTSSTAGFLAAVDPRIAVFQAGYRNRFGHPSAEVLRRYEGRAVEIITTARCGAFRWSGGVGGCERDRRRRYWHHGLATHQGAP